MESIEVASSTQDLFTSSPGEDSSDFPALGLNSHSGPICALILERENAIEEWRRLIGPSHIHNQPKDLFTIRKAFAFSDTFNAVHGSGTQAPHPPDIFLLLTNPPDSPEAAQREMEFLFGKE